MKQSITEKIEIMLDMGEWDAAKKMIAALEAENQTLKAVVEMLRGAVKEVDKHYPIIAGHVEDVIESTKYSDAHKEKWTQIINSLFKLHAALEAGGE